ncbi:MAG TPA: succinyldiaminopimelate transaminase [Nocardioidaceae bacterium]|nr:succinyldiaminopimelate transaminase [Nocardioidaceae bacterium]
MCAATAPPAAGRPAGRLPEFPWDVLAPYKERAARHPDGLVDLSIGTPVDPTPEPVRQALGAAADSPGYPSVAGTARLRTSIRAYLQRRCGAPPLADASILPTIGSKELVASLPSLLDLGPDRVVLVPALAYPTYGVGAILSGAQVVASDATLSAGPAPIGLVWVNSPANPHGRVLPVDHLRKVVSWARERGAVVASDECYFEFGWDAEPVSVLDPRVNGGSLDGVLALHSLSKRSNLAGYRAAFVAGDPVLVADLYAVRRHAGLMLPGPVQAAMSVALDDDEHVERQRGRYLARRTALRTAFERAGFRIDHSEGSLYLWATRDEPCWDSVGWLAERGILVTPGEFYGRTGGRHVRVALTVADAGVAAVAERLA